MCCRVDNSGQSTHIFHKGGYIVHLCRSDRTEIYAKSRKCVRFWYRLHPRAFALSLLGNSTTSQLAEHAVWDDHNKRQPPEFKIVWQQEAGIGTCLLEYQNHRWIASRLRRTLGRKVERRHNGSQMLIAFPSVIYLTSMQLASS